MVMRNTTFSLSTYMISLVVLVHIILSPALYFIILDIYKKSASELFITDAHNIAGILADDLSDKHIKSQYSSIVNTLDSAILGGNILYIDILSNNNKLIIPSDQLEISSQNFNEDEFLNQNNDTIYYISIPIHLTGDSNINYKLRLGFDESFVNEQIQAIKNRIILILLSYVFSMVTFFTIITHYILKPLKLLRRTSNTIAGGEVNFPLEVITNISDIKLLSTDLEKMRITLLKMTDNIQLQATHDELTGLPNRYLHSDRMHQAVALSLRNKQSFSVLLLDLNRFKEINDTLGHGAGDYVLKTISERMTDNMRDSDTIARIGGDEFCIILIDTDIVDALNISRKIIQIIEPPIKHNGHSLQVSASVGISLYPDHGTTPELLLQRADVAMYSAKNSNKSIALYNSEMDSKNYENLLLANDLKNSISNNHFESVFQPKIDLATQKTCGCEMLLRWRHPYLGLIYPDKFIPLAEQENLIGELTRWATSRCLNKFLDILKFLPDFQIAINVSPMSLLDTKLLASLLEILESSQFPAKNLIIEVTENIIMKDPERSAEILNKFNDEGIKIAIDDFGTGYSSLSYLQKFPISELKIDKTFITDLSKSSTNYPIVKASITMAHELGLTVVAEGIEGEEAHDMLVELGCDRVQGYHYCKPLSFHRLAAWLEQNNDY